jgi:D-3-phosphoglycerate dehydrogenase
MINFRVRDLDGLLKKLKSEGIEQVGKMEDYDFGRFAWIIDPEGTKNELWEPGPGMPD